MATITKQKRLKILLERGFFPIELPPPFNTQSFAKYRKSITDSWPTNYAPKTQYERYSIKRIGLKRRQLAIVNPISQYYLSKHISDNWITIRDHLSYGVVSLDRAIISEEGERAIEKPDFRLVQSAKLNASANDDFIFRSDISRFYDTIYTHAIAWALEGKQWCKSNIGSALNSSIGGELDILVRKCQDNQSQGIPTGPDTSRILSEVLAIGVERNFLASANVAPEDVYRYVDDWFIGIGSPSDGEDLLRKLSRSMAEYSLDLNIEKTTVLHPSDPIWSFWPDELLDCMVEATSSREQSRQISLFFSRSFDLAAKNKSQNVLLYSIKLARSFPITRANFSLFEGYLFKIARADNLTIPIVTQILANYRLNGFSVSARRLDRLIDDVIRSSAPLMHTEEVAWALFLAKALRREISKDLANLVIEMSSSVCSLILLDLERLSLLEGGSELWTLQQKMTSSSLRDENWLLAYEADVKGWLQSAESTNHVDSDPYFSTLKARRIEFYDINRNVKTFRRSRRDNVERLRRRRTSNQLFAFLMHAHGNYEPPL
ncbi:RNA-directed DNA polymerase [Aliiroseovarius marinus]|uniref:RNA-directed DNA polymerase n=1 Tax=Aliiroseovarius marinus TaxID=2500159 RepID=UPI00105FDF40|nr:RNA-directed DNA polymerase [Aliiroseovarius marinus]